MKEEWLFPNAFVPVDVETTSALLAEIKRLIGVVGGMALECPNCEYHKDRAARWRAEAYAQAGHDVIERPWVGLTDEEINLIYAEPQTHIGQYARAIEAKLKDKNEQIRNT